MIREGHKSALANARKVKRGSKFFHGVAGAVAVLEICILLLALGACQHGFQTLVVAGLGLIYCPISFFAVARGHNSENQFAALAFDLTRIRKLLKDRHLDWRYVVALRDSKREALAKSEIRVYIAITKLAIMELICIAAMIISSF